MPTSNRFKHIIQFFLSLLGLLIFNGLCAQTKVSARLTDITIQSGRSNFYVELKGGDGGNATTGNCNAYGGSGTTVKALFEVGDGIGQIKVGSTLRFIKGEKGGSENFTLQAGAGDAGGGGGGGSAVLYREPGLTSDTAWQILAVAGGGGGAYSGAFAWSCTDKDNGRGGRSETSGGSGKVQTGTNTSGGTKGEAGEGFNDTSGGGAGAFASAVKRGTSAVAATKGYPAGGAGASCAGCESGGWGFGGGGFSFYGSGGGGGYSGGGAGSIDYAGGGGSYLSTKKIEGEITAGENGGGKEADGYILYQFDYTSWAHPIQSSTSSSKCLGTYNNTISKGANIELTDCTRSIDQDWRFYDGVIKLAKNEGMCLDLTSSNTSNGTNIQLWECNDTKAQKWIYDVNNQYLRSTVNTSKCLYPFNGSNIQLYSCGESSNQQWIMENVSSSMREGETLRLHFAKNPSKCLDFKNAATSNGTNIILYNCHYTNSQYLQFDGTQIKMQSSGKCVDVKSGSTSNGANIQLWGCNGTDAQQFIYDGFTNTFRFKKNMNKCIDVKSGNTDNGTNIQLWDCNDSDAQKWYFYQ